MEIEKLGIGYLSEQTFQNVVLPVRIELNKLAVEGGEFNTLVIPPSGRMLLSRLDEEMQIRTLIFYHGTCGLQYGDTKEIIEEVAIFVQDRRQEVVLTANKSSAEVLEFIMNVNNEDLTWLDNIGHPHHSLFYYSKSKPYAEEIKSPKTVSRTLLPQDVVPRLSIGSVYTTGPDAVGAHEHAMLEQWFLGLADNSSIIHIEQDKFAFPKLSLAHIPLGSSHGVSVEDGKTMHYLWIDMFHTLEGMGYLEEQHKPL